MDFEYRAFMSYSHAADGKLAPALQRGLQRIGKPWYRRPVIKVFRDETSLGANPGLWSEIERNLARSAFFILMASIQAARSPWVRKEVQWWLAHRSPENLLIVLTEGEIAWSSRANDFDWDRSTCLPLDLRGCFHAEPLYIDLRWAKGREALSLRHAKFRDAALTLAAPLCGRPKDELDSEEIRQHRRFRMAATGATILLNVLVVVSIYYFWNARQEATRAEASWREARFRMLAAASINKLEEDKNIDDAIKVALMAWKLAATDQARAALQRMAEASSDMARILGQHTVGIAALAFSSDSSLLATMGRDGSIQLWKAGTWTPATPLLAGGLRNAEGLRFDGAGAHLLAWAKDGAMELWDIRSRTKQAILEFVKLRQPDEYRPAALNGDGNLIAVVGKNGLLAIWDMKSETLHRAPVSLGDKPTLGVHFAPDGRLLLVQLYGYGLRVGVWDIATGKTSIGPPIKDLGFNFYPTEVSFRGTGTKFVTSGETFFRLWEIGGALTLREVELKGSGRKCIDCRSPALDADGKLLFVRVNAKRWEKWDVSATPVLVAEGSLQNWAEPTWSPDGRWRADVVGGGWRADDVKWQRILVWDVKSGVAAGLAKAIDAECNFHDDQSGCVRRLCEKISPSLDEKYLRELFGIESYEVMYDRYKSSIKGSLCDH